MARGKANEPPPPSDRPKWVAQQAEGHPNGVAFRLERTEEPVDDLPNGTEVLLLEAAGEWSHVAVGERRGWVKARNLQYHGPRIARQADGHANGVALRAARAEEPYEDIPNGTELPVLQLDGEWAQVRYAGATGWVKTRNLQLPPPPAAPAPAAAGGASAAALALALGVDASRLRGAEKVGAALLAAAPLLRPHARRAAVMRLGVGADGAAFQARRRALRSADVPAGVAGFDGLLQLWGCANEGGCGAGVRTSVARVVAAEELSAAAEVPAELPRGVEAVPLQLMSEGEERWELPNGREAELLAPALSGHGEVKQWLDDEFEFDRIGVKVGGWPSWLEAEQPKCAECGKDMGVALLQFEAGAIDGVSLGGKARTAHVVRCEHHPSQLVYVWARK
ncbi:hypothetical protein AB1Y20_008161 [Prymnesium parvum]|uniref:SH3 domain-containing protein n=1 Tax=Prymnesium parvum TaxID=97485 RepID=A0AB34IU57_PRYPA